MPFLVRATKWRRLGSYTQTALLRAWSASGMDNYLEELDSLESTMVAVMCTTLDTATATILYSKDTCPLDHGYDEVLKCFQRFKANYQQTAGTKPPGRRFHRGFFYYFFK